MSEQIKKKIEEILASIENELKLCRKILRGEKV